MMVNADGRRASCFRTRTQVATEGVSMLSEPRPQPLSEEDQRVFGTLVPQEHYLRRVLRAIDFERFREHMAPAYSPNQGRPAEDPVLMFKLGFLQYHDNLSDRRVMERAQTDVAYRLFLGLPLSCSLPHASSLTYFRGRLGAERHRQLFDELVAQAREHGLVKDRLRLKDATHVIANVAIPSTLRLVAQVREKLLAAAAPYEPLRVEGEQTRVEMIRQSDEGLSQEERLLSRIEHLQGILDWADELPPPAEADAAWQKLLEARQLAHKLLHDQQRKTGRDRTVSSHDPDARYGKHGRWFCGYKLDLSMDADSQIITAIDALLANADEAANATELIGHEEEVQGNDVQGLSIDSIGFDGSRLEEWTDPEGLNLEVTVPPKKEPPTDHFTAADFVEDESGEAVVCPAGHKSYRRNRNEKDTGWMYRFRRATCAACPLLSRCMKQLPQDKSKGRTVTKNDYQPHYDAARAKAETESYRQVRKEHPAVERKLSELTNRHGARRARSRGRPKVQIQMLQTGFVVNVKRMVRLLSGLQGATT